MRLALEILSLQLMAILVQCDPVIVYSSFSEYKASLNKTYSRKYEESRSQRAYEENLKTILAHNKLFDEGKTLFQLRANALADLTSRQYLRSYVRLERSHPSNESDEVGASFHDQSFLEATNTDDLPSSFDWRKYGFRTSIDNQLTCGSCYAYSVARSVEAQIYKRIGKLIPLSQQQIVDCSTITGNHGCSGGSLKNTMKYLQDHGLMRRKDYPYLGKQKKCQYMKELAVINIQSWAILPPKDEEALRIAVAVIGPVPVSINASPKTFQLYSHGIYDDPNCSSAIVNHAMLVVGYTPDYWILKNWWGENWGDKGYMRIRRHKNLCGLANFAAYAIV